MSYTVTEARLLRINLTLKTIKIEKIEKELFLKFLGGRGLGSKYLIDEIDPKIDALSEANKLIFANGLLTGTIAPTGGRYMVVTKSPLTGTIASSNSGGFFGAEFRNTGFMMIIIEGISAEPVYISINGEDVKINDAKALWGLSTHETTDKLLETFGVEGAKVACIGPAGENLSKIASIMNDKNRAAGRSGVGAVMGSKNLKAIILKGSRKVDIEQQEKFREIVKVQNGMLKAHPVTGEGLPALGTKVLDNIINSSGLYPTRNFQSAIFSGVAEVCGEALVNKKYLQNNTACYGCVIACGREVALPNGLKGEGPEYESGWSLGADCGVNDLISITEANFLCNELGLDTISAGATIALAMELYENGYIPKEDLENMVEPRFGNSEAVVYYVKGMAYRETKLAAKMADGAYRLGEAYGHPELAMVVKKQELPAYDPRGVQGHGLQYATSNRGGCHVRGYMISPEILGVPEKLDPQALEGKPTWVKIFQDLTAVIDSAGLCLFSSFALGGDEYRDLINAALDTDFTTEEILKTGDRIWNLERKFNLDAGILPDQDTLPDRLLHEPLPDGPQKGCYSQLLKILPEYYQLRGWDEKGYIKTATLQDLGLI